MNTNEALKQLWGEQVFADYQDDIARIWKNKYFPKTRSAQCMANFFVKKTETGSIL